MNTTKGIFYSILAVSLIGSMNACAKLLAPYISPMEITFWRGVTAALFLTVGLVLLGKSQFIKTRNPKAQFIRAFVGTTTMTLNMWAITLLPLSTVSSIRLTSPLIVLLLSWPLLGEKVGPRRMAAAMVGFLGAAIIINPFALWGEPIPTKGLIVTLVFTVGTAFVDLTLRWIGNKQKEPGLTTAFYFLVLSALFTLPFAVFMPSMPAAEIILNPETSWFLLGLGAMGALGMVFKSESFKLAPVSVISPISYSILIWSVFYDWMIWKHLPSLNVYIGAAVIIAANIFVVWREKQLHKQVHSASESPSVA